MKKVLFVLAFVAVYGVSIAMTSSAQVISIDETVTVVVDADDKVEKEEGKKEAKACSGEKAAKKSDCSSSCGGEKAAKKSDCSSSCSGKTAAKKDCSSSCSGKK